MRIVMIGTGYVGLVSGACFSDFGHNVCCVDKDAGKVEALREGRIPIFEPGLDELVERNVAAGQLEFTLDLASADGERSLPVAEFFRGLLATGPSHSAGRQMSAHFSARQLNVASMVGPVGNNALPAVGNAQAVRHLEGDPVVV